MARIGTDEEDLGGFFILKFLSVILREIRGQNFLNLMGALAVMDELAD
jgi:hypothetical protein